MEQDLKDINREIEIQSSGWYKLSQRLEPIGRSLQDVGKRMTDIGKNLSMKVMAPLVGLGAVVAKTGMDFEATMSEVGAISGAAGSDLAALENIAKEMGATTKFSASEAAEGLKYMAMAGGATVVVGLSAGFPALGAAVTIATGPIGFAVAAIAGLTAGGIVLYRHLKPEAIPAVNLFGDEISEAA